jgi:Rhomboid family
MTTTTTARAPTTAPARTPRWRRVYRAVADYLAAAPGTHILLLIVAVTTLVLRGLDAPTTTRILRHQSTNLFQMSRDAPRVLVLSAFLLDNGRLLVEAAYFTLVVAPVERWVGTYRWLATFAAGHIGATLATTVGIWLQVRQEAERGLVYPVDVGVSYGVAAMAGVLVYRFRRPWNLVWFAVVAVDVGAAVISTGTFTDWGHLVAFGIGLAMGPLVRPDPGDRRHLLVVLGAGLLAAAVFCLVLLLTVPDRDIAVPETGPTVDVTVVGRPPECGPACQTVVVRYVPPVEDGGAATPQTPGSPAPAAGSPAVPATATTTATTAAVRRPVEGILVLPQQTLTQRGQHLLAVADAVVPGRLRPLRPPQRVSPDSLFGAIAAALGVTGTALLLLARRVSGRPRPEPGEAEPGEAAPYRS